MDFWNSVLLLLSRVSLSFFLQSHKTFLYYLKHARRGFLTFLSKFKGYFFLHVYIRLIDVEED